MREPSAGRHRFEWLRLAEGRARQVLRYTLYPLTFAAFVGGGVLLFEHFEPTQVGLAVFFVTIPLFFLLERIIPWSQRWVGSKGDVHTDVGLSLMAAFVGPLVGPLTEAASLVAIAWLANHFGQALWPTSWPLLAQGALALVVADFFRYWTHRALHQWPLLWRVHATHHSAERLYFYNGVRVHPLEMLLEGVVQGIPLIVLGIPPEALAVRFLMGRVIGRFQHCNLDLELGPLDYVFSSPKNHRWHHSKDLGEAAHNYGGDVILWDHVFGTFFLPRDREPSDEIGIGNMPDFPRGILGVLLSPFHWKRYLVEPSRAGAS